MKSSKKTILKEPGSYSARISSDDYLRQCEVYMHVLWLLKFICCWQVSRFVAEMMKTDIIASISVICKCD